LSVPDLMRLFGKVGGVEATLNPVSATAYITFSAPESIAKFLAQASHTVSETGITQLAQVGPCQYRKCGGACYCCHPKERMSSTSSTTTCSTTSDVTTDPEVMPLPAQSNCSAFVAATGTNAPATPLTLSTLPMPSQSAVSFGSFQADQNGVNYGCFPAQSVSMPMMTRTTTSPAWRCVHSNIVISSAEPELLATGCGICVQWPTVVHASAYVVELFDQVTMVAQRFTHVAAECPLPALMSMRIDGLQTSAYAACVRCVAPCGCESVASPWSFMSGMMPMAPPVQMPQMLPTNAPHMLPQIVVPHSCPPPPSAPPAFPPTAAAPKMSLTAIPEDSAHSTEICHESEDILTLD